MRYRRVGTLVSASLIIGALLITAAPAAADGNKHGRAQVLLDGLSSPKALAIGSKSVVVGQGAFGPPGPVLEYVFKGSKKGTSTPVTGPLNVTDIAKTPDRAWWAIGGDGVIYRMAPGGAMTPILDMAVYQASDPDPNNLADDPAETNPYGIAALKNNDVLIADAAGNDIIRVSPDGSAVTVARFATRLVRTDKVGDPSLPPKLPAEAVPTSIAIGRDGWAYVGQLVGFPGRPGSAKIWRVNPYGEGATCDASHRTRNCKVWKSGFTSIVDLAFNPNNGRLYVYEIAKKGWLAFEAGFAPGGEFPKAVLLEVRRGHKPRELAKGKLSQPGGVVVARDGSIFVTDGMFTGGRLLRIRR